MLNILLVSAALTAQPPALEILDPRPTYGHLGAARPKPAGMLPGDVACFTFGIKNLKLDENGLAKYAVGIEVRDSAGKLIHEQKPFNTIAQNVFGGDVVPNSATLAVPLTQPPTDLTWKITVQDRLAGTKVEKSGAGKVLPADFGLVQIGTFADAQSQVPIAPVGVIGGTVFLNFSAVGFGRDKDKKPDLNIELKIVDEAGKPTLPKAMTGRIQDNIPEDAKFIPLHFGLSLNRPGNFTIQVEARDAVSGKTANFSLPVRILPMQ